MPIATVGVGKIITVPRLGVMDMVKSDLLSGLLVGVALGLYFTPQLAPHLAIIVILAVVFGTKMIRL